jgi:hypothetical protein
MAIAQQGTFGYVAIVPEKSGAEFECRGGLRDPIVLRGDERSDSRLVGHAPLIQVTEAGLTPDAGPERPWVMRSRITLRAPDRHLASVAEVSFHVDRALMACSRPGDELHLTRTSSGGLGLSIIRGGALVVSTGAITAVPSGRAVEARDPRDLVARAEAVFRERDPAFRLRDWPVEVSVDGARSILSRGSPTLGEYRVFIVHGYEDGVPGTDACGAIYRKGQCPDAAAEASALLMAASDALSMRRW